MKLYVEKSNSRSLYLFEKCKTKLCNLSIYCRSKNAYLITFFVSSENQLEFFYFKAKLLKVIKLYFLKKK